MIIGRREGHVEVLHSSGKRAVLVHRTNDMPDLVYVRVSPFATCNWPRHACTFHFIAK